jgi:hypothetical protein
LNSPLNLVKQDWEESNTHSFQILNINKKWRQLSYLDNPNFKLFKSLGIKYFLSIVNQEWSVISRFSSVVTYWTPTHGVTGSNTSDVIFFMQPPYCFTSYKLLFPKVFLKSVNVHQYMALLQVELFLIPLLKFARPPYWY